MKKHAFKYLPWTPEGKLERKFQRDTAAQQEDEAHAARQEQEREDRLDAPVSRRELLAALEAVRYRFAGNAQETQYYINEAFELFRKELE